uniref:Exonuclease domain-containing protein n=1 Tax=Stomoxys calcitrans TaxID=35570 RepID=A0A1I8NQP9_STOCA
MIFKLNNLFLNNKLSQLICKNKSTASILILREKSQFMQTCTYIVWMDLEMTGLDVLNDKIIEVSSVITDKEMNIIAEGPCFAVHHPAVVFENMNSWCKKHHYESGLVEKCLKSQITTSKGQELLLDFFKAYIPKGECALAGNSVYMDRLWATKERKFLME